MVGAVSHVDVPCDINGHSGRVFELAISPTITAPLQDIARGLVGFSDLPG
jgi:hypothetical protein